MHLLVCYLNKLQNARCNDKDSWHQFTHEQGRGRGLDIKPNFFPLLKEHVKHIWKVCEFQFEDKYWGADKSLARSGRKRATFPAFYGTWRFITTFTTVHHLTLPKSNQSIPLPITLLTGAAFFPFLVGLKTYQHPGKILLLAQVYERKLFSFSSVSSSSSRPSLSSLCKMYLTPLISHYRF